MSESSVTVRLSPFAVLVGVLALAAACGGGSSAATKPSSNQSPTSTTAPSAPPGAFGTAAAVSTSSLEVQNPTVGQVTVNFTGTTKLTQQVAAAASDVVTGACVAANGGQGTSGATPGQPFTARTVTVTQPEANGGCTPQGAGLGGFGGFGGQRADNGAGGGGGGGPSTTARPGNGQSRNPNGARRFAVAFGKVVSVSGPTFVVQGTNRNGATTTTTVTDDTSTTFTKVVSVGPSALAVGQCIAANGPSDQSGAVSATSIDIRQPGPNGCFIGNRGGPGGAGNGNGGNGGNGSATTS